MMSFYSAVGSYQIRTDHGAKMPYIQKLGKLYPLSIPEFVVWSTLLWEVMTYDDLKREYDAQMASVDIKAPELDQMLQLLLKRRLIIEGVGYTGIDALYNMMADAFVIPYRISKNSAGSIDSQVLVQAPDSNCGRYSPPPERQQILRRRGSRALPR